MNITYGNLNDLLHAKYRIREDHKDYSNGVITVFLPDIHGKYNDRLWGESNNAPQKIEGLYIEVQGNYSRFMDVRAEDVISVKRITHNYYEGIYAISDKELIDTDKIPIKID